MLIIIFQELQEFSILGNNGSARFISGKEYNNKYIKLQGVSL